MIGHPAATTPGRVVPPPSMASLARDAIRALILGGDLRPGERLVESALTERLGVSRPPVREALKELAHEGLVVPLDRRGVVVATLTQHDVYEILTLRDDLEAMAVRLALPLDDDSRLDPVRSALRDLEDATEPAQLVELGFAFHLEVVRLAGHRRLVETYRGLALQMQLCMSLNVDSRREHEGAAGNAARHRVLVEALETGDPAVAQVALREHGHRSFLPVVAALDGATPESSAWLASVEGDTAT